MAMMIDVALVALVLGLTVVIAKEGLWGAALVFFDTLFAGIIAFGTFEFLGSRLEANIWLGGFPRFICLVGVFCITMSILRVITDKLGPRRVKFPGVMEQALKFVFAGLTAWIATGMVVCMYQVAPVSKAPFQYRFGQAIFGVGIDRHWLAVVHYTTRYTFGWNEETAFPPPSQFIEEYEEFRPFGRAPRGR